jgi:glycosyltransferase involved in cell wall biosynthesis
MSEFIKPNVTIGICAHNSEKTIRAALESALQQRYPSESIEIVFVDDGSQDKTLQIVKSYVPKAPINLKVFSSAWKGLGHARNIVINNALGKYIVWLDSDEIFAEDFLLKVVTLMEKNPKAGIITGQLAISREENTILKLDLIPSVVDLSCQTWHQIWKLPGTGGATFRVQAAKEVGGFDTNVTSVGEDTDIALRIRKAGWLILSSDAVFHETHGCLSTWSGVRKRAINQGRRCQFVYRKDPVIFSLYRINPVSSFIVSFKYAILGFKITKLASSFILPFYYTFKMTAWFYGFTKN